MINLYFETGNCWLAWKQEETGEQQVVTKKRKNAKGFILLFCLISSFFNPWHSAFALFLILIVVMSFRAQDVADKCCLKTALPNSFHQGPFLWSINSRVRTDKGAKGYYFCTKCEGKCQISCDSAGEGVEVNVKTPHSCSMTEESSGSINLIDARRDQELMVKTLCLDFPARNAPSISMEVYRSF